MQIADSKPQTFTGMANRFGLVAALCAVWKGGISREIVYTHVGIYVKLNLTFT